MDDFIRQVEASTKDAMRHSNAVRLQEAKKRAASDVSVHNIKSFEPLRRPASGPHARTELKPGTRILLSSASTNDVHALKEAPEEYDLLTCWNQKKLEQLPQLLANHRLKEKSKSLSQQKSKKSLPYDPLPSIESVSAHLEDLRAKATTTPEKKTRSTGDSFTAKSAEFRATDYWEDANVRADDDEPLPLHPSAEVLENLGYSTKGNPNTSEFPEKRREARRGKGRKRQRPRLDTTLAVYKDRSLVKPRKPQRRRVDDDDEWNIDPSIDVSGDVLWSRFRDEERREEEWRAMCSALRAATDLENDEKVVIPIESIERHPVAKWVSGLVDEVNLRLRRKILTRNRVKKFSLDIQSVWEANVAHLREHHTFDQASGLCRARRGLEGGRDSEAIVEGESQIQSVNVTRALDGAYYTNQNLELEILNKDAEASPSSQTYPKASLPPALGIPSILAVLVWEAPLQYPTNSDGYGKYRHLVTIDAMMRPYTRSIMWRFHVYDRHVGSHRWLSISEGEAKELSKYMGTLSAVESDEDEGEESCESSDISESDSDGTLSSEDEEDDCSHCGIATDALVVFCDDASSARRNKLRLRRFDRDYPRRFNRLAVSLVSLLENPETEPAEVLERQRITLNGLEHIQQIRRERKERRLREREERLRREEEEHLRKNRALAEARARAHELALMRGEEAWERHRLAVVAAADEREDIEAKCNDLFLMCPRTRRLRVKRQDFVQVLEEEPQVVEALKLRECLPPDVIFDLKEKNEWDQPLSETSIGVVFDCIDSWSGFTLGEISVETMAKYMLQHTATKQLPPEYNEEEDEQVVPQTKREINDGSQAAIVTIEQKLESVKEVKGTWDGVDVTDWESEMDSPSVLYPLSIRCSERSNATRQVPGVLAIGKAGLWWKYPQDSIERTRIAAVYFRDVESLCCSTQSVLVKLLLALDTPALAPQIGAWEFSAYTPASPPHLLSLPLPSPPMLASIPVAQPFGHLGGAYDCLVAPSCAILNVAERVEDFGEFLEKGSSNAMSLPHRRFWDDYDHRRFRVVMPSMYSLWPREEMKCWTFAIRTSSLSTSAPGVSRRHTWHSEQRCVEQLSRRRGPKDIYEYLDFTSLVRQRNPNEPACMIVHLDAGTMHSLERWTLSAYEALYQQIQEEREKAAKAEALQARIEATAVEIKSEKLGERLNEHMLSRRKRRRRKGAVPKQSPSIGMQAWRDRLARSTLLAQQDQWQKWMDTKAGDMVFFYDTHPESIMPFQWDPPHGWSMTLVDVASNALGVDSSLIQSMETSSVVERGLQSSTVRADPLQRTSSLALVDPSRAGQGTIQSVAQREQDALEERTESHRRELVRSLIDNPSFVTAVASKLRAVREHLRAKRDQFVVTSPRDEDEGRELGSDEDPWSASDDEAGEFEGDVGFLPQSFADLRRQRIEERKARLAEDGPPRLNALVSDFQLPFEKLGCGLGRGNPARLLRPGVTILQEIASRSSELRSQQAFAIRGEDDYDEDDVWGEASLNTSLSDQGQSRQHVSMAEPVRYRSLPRDPLIDHVGGRGWRGLNRANPESDFIQKTQVRSCAKPSEQTNVINTTSELRMLGAWDMREDTGYALPDFSRPFATMFVDNALSVQLERQEKEKAKAEFNQEMASELSLKQLVSQRADHGITEFTSVDRFLADRKAKGMENMNTYIGWAMTAVKNNDLARLEEIVDDYNVDIDSKDDNGSTLLILAAQQGFKRVVKYLLRKHANINAQTNMGNTALHYAFEYGHAELGNYLISKGADSDLLNAQGLTCFEGLNQEDVNLI